jgi:hypothetical protein
MLGPTTILALLHFGLATMWPHTSNPTPYSQNLSGLAMQMVALNGNMFGLTHSEVRSSNFRVGGL